MLLLCAAFNAAVFGAVPKIDTIVVLMEENRAFDHMLGYMARGGPQGKNRKSEKTIKNMLDQIVPAT